MGTADPLGTREAAVGRPGAGGPNLRGAGPPWAVGPVAAGGGRQAAAVRKAGVVHILRTSHTAISRLAQPWGGREECLLAPQLAGGRDGRSPPTEGH